GGDCGAAARARRRVGRGAGASRGGLAPRQARRHGARAVARRRVAFFRAGARLGGRPLRGGRPARLGLHRLVGRARRHRLRLARPDQGGVAPRRPPSAARRPRRRGPPALRRARHPAPAPRPASPRRGPFLLEAETIIVVVLLFAAASLSSQPPARDTTDERASIAEVARVFEPKWPALHTPSVQMMQQSSADPYAAVGAERAYEDYSWSNCSHNVAGLGLLAMSLLALAAARPRWRWARHWPLGVALLGVFVFLRSLAVDAVWPFGSGGFWATTLDSAEDLQHSL